MDFTSTYSLQTLTFLKLSGFHSFLLDSLGIASLRHYFVKHLFGFLGLRFDKSLKVFSFHIANVMVLNTFYDV